MCSHTSAAQNPDTIIVTGSFEEGYAEFFNRLGSQYNLVFYYKPEWLGTASIDRVFEMVTLTRVLEDVLDDISCTYLVVPPNIIAILPLEEVKSVLDRSAFALAGSDNVQVIGKQEDAGRIKRPEIRGTVVDGKDGKPIIGAIIAVQDNNFGTTSDIQGNFILNLAPGVHYLVISSIGYEQKTYTIKLIGNGSIYIELFESSVKLEEVIVSAQRNDRNVQGNQISLVELDRKSIRQIPPLFGEKDVIKGLTTMPGVKTVGEFGSGIHVRGGSTDQNLFLVEGAPVFNTSHVFGLLSVISPDAVSNVSLYKGYIPASYGERISSVTDIRMKEGSFNKFQANGGIGLLNSRLMVETPLVRDKASMTIGGRTSYSDWLLKKMPDMDLRNSSAWFYDLFGSVSLIAGPKDKAGMFAYASSDQFRYADDILYNYSNYLGTIHWDHQYHERLSSRLALSHSRYRMDHDAIGSEYEMNRISTGITYTGLKLDFSAAPGPAHTLHFGLQGIYYSLNPGVQQPLGSKSLTLHKDIHSEQGAEMAVFLGNSYEPAKNISIQAGLRFSGYAFLGPNRVNLYQAGTDMSPETYVASQSYASGDVISRYFNFEPRAALKVILGETSSMKVSYNRNVQYLNLISYTSVPTPDDIWKLCSPYLRPATSDQVAAGYFRNFSKNAIETSVEVYYKNLQNLVEYKNGARISMNDMLETELVNARGTNYGIELLIRKNTGTFDGWISYTYSRSLKQTTGNYSTEIINSNRIYPSSYDKPHDLTIVGTYHYNKRLRITCSFNHASGRAVTLPEVRFRIGDKEYVNYSERNTYRLPYYQRLDLSISLDETLYLKRKWKGSWSFSVINLLGRNNAYSVIYKEADPSASNDFSRFGLYKLYIIGQPLPTLTYNFIF